MKGQKLPQTRGALYIKPSLVHVSRLWCGISTKCPPPTDNGWNKDGDCPLFITTLIPLAPTFITFITYYLVICGCKQNKCCSKCSCRSQQLNCSEMCPCGAHKDVCENVGHDETLGSMMKRRRIYHSKNCEITTCLADNIIL